MKQDKTEARLVAAIQTEMTNSSGSNSDELQARREKAINYYLGKPRNDEVEGRSQVVSMDLASSVQATLALMRGMCIDDAAVTIEAFSTDDEALAKAEGDITADVIYKENQGALRVMSSIKDSLLSGQAVIAVDVEVDKEGENHIAVRSVPSENIQYQSAYEGDLQDIRFWAEMVPYTRSDLVDMGLPKAKVWKLASLDIGQNSVASARNVDGIAAQTTAAVTEMDIIECYWCFLMIDLDGSGIAKRHRVLFSNEMVLEYEEHDILPYALGSPMISAHRLDGESLADKLFQVQDVGTALRRQLLDNIAMCNQGRFAYDPGTVSEDDVMTMSTGIRARQPRESIVPIMVPDVTMGILAGIQNNKKDRAEIAGSALEMASAEGQMMNKSATAASIDKSNSELVTTLIATNLAETLIIDTFRLVHEYLRRYATRNYLARVAGQSVEVDPKQWAKNRRFIVQAGKSPTEKQMMAQTLSMNLQMQMQLLGSGMGGILADAKTIYRTSQDILRLNGIQDAETYAVDPTSPPAQQAGQQMQAQQAQQAQMQQQLQEMMVQLEKMKIAEDGRQSDNDIAFRYYDSDQDAEIAAAKITGDATLELEKQARDQQASIAGSYADIRGNEG